MPGAAGVAAATTTGRPDEVAPGRGPDPGEPGPPEARDPVERLWPWLNAAFGGLALLSLTLVLLDADASPVRRLAGVPVLVAVVAAYLGLVRPFRGASRDRVRWNLAYAAVAAAGFVALSLLHASWWFLGLAVFFQVWMLLPLPVAATLSAGLSLFLWSRSTILDGGPFRPTLAGVLIFAAVTLVSTMLGVFIEAIARQSAQRGRLLGELRAERAARLAAERERGALAERGRLSRDLHDTLAQDLTGIVLRLETAAAAMPAGAVGHHEVVDATRIARDALGEVRHLLWALRPAPLRGDDLAGALGRVVARWGEEHGLRADVRWDGESTALPPGVEVTLLRVTQEALGNVARHAAATGVDVVVTVFDDAVNLDVRDDGRGLRGDAPARPAGTGARDDHPAGTGLGLVGMRERVEALGGTLAVESEPGAGTTVAVAIPLSTAPPVGVPDPGPHTVGPVDAATGRGSHHAAGDRPEGRGAAGGRASRAGAGAGRAERGR